MARILYTVCGIGMGHATRSGEIIHELKKNHQVMVASYGQAFEYLKKKFLQTTELKWFELEYSNGKYDKPKTLLSNISKIPSIFSNNYSQLVELAKDFQPEIIVSDFDVNSVYLGELLGLPVIVISNMHLMEHIKFELDFKDRLMFLTTEKPILKSFIGTDYFFIPTISKETDKENVFFYYPLLRKEIIESKPKKGEHYLVYIEKESLERAIPILKKTSKKFKVYGKNVEKKDGNIEFKAFSEKGFLNDLASCKAVISHGGLSLISEALFLGKPVFVTTLKSFFERYFNGIMIKKNGFGMLGEKLSIDKMEEFFSKEKEFVEKISKASIVSENKEMIRKMEEVIAKECSH